MTSNIRPLVNEGQLAEAVTADGLRASHDVMISLEKCKSSSENIIDSLPDIFAIITRDGRILKGNFEAAKCLNVDFEQMIESNITDLFHGETKLIFKTKIEAFPEGAKEVTFELPLKHKDDRSVEYFWTISTFDQLSRRRGQLFRVLGRDISEIREFEKKLTQIFSAIPLGILTVLANGEIEWPYSQYSEYLLDSSVLDGKNIEDVLYKPVWENLDSVEKMGASQLVKAIGTDPMWFELSKLHFPREIFKSGSDGEEGIWLGISYHPIIHENVVEKIMIIIEDKSEVIKARKAMEVQRHIEDGRVKRILEVQECSGALLEVTFSDFDNLIPRLIKGVEDRDLKIISRALHAIKGVARTAGFSIMKGIVHECEEQVVTNLDSPEKVDWDKLTYDCQSIQKESDELRSVCFALTGRSNSLQIRHENFQEVILGLHTLLEKTSSTHHDNVLNIMSRLGISHKSKPIEFMSFNQIFEKEAIKFSNRLGKKLTLEFNWYGASAFKNDAEKFYEIFLQLMVNAIEHGIEAVKDRKQKNKAESGRIIFNVTKHADGVEFTVTDDGAGIDTDHILKIAKENRYISPKKKLVSREDVYKIIVKPGFSSKGDEQNISGRGIGLSSVNDAISSLGGDGIKIASQKDKGSTFSFKIPLKMIQF